MIEWENKEIDLGDIPENKRMTMVFKPKSDLSNIESLTSSCGCSKPEITEKGVKVHYKSGRIPKHLQKYNSQAIRKTITVVYRDGSKDILSFKGVIKRV